MRTLTSILSLGAFTLSVISYASSDHTDNQLFALKGTCQIEGQWMLSIRDNSQERHFWMSPGQSYGALKLISYDAKTGHAELSYLRQTIRLELAKGDHIPLEVIGSPESTPGEELFSPIAKVSNPLTNPQILPSALLARELQASDDQQPVVATSAAYGSPSSSEPVTPEGEPGRTDTSLASDGETKSRARNYFMSRMNRVESALEGNNIPAVMPEGM